MDIRQRFATGLVVFTTGVALWASVPAVVAADIDDNAIARAKKTLQAKQDVITFFAHPTAMLTKIDFLSMDKTDAGFKLIYRLDYVSARKKPFYSKLAFEFDVDGNYRAVTSVATSALVEPFTASGLVVQYVKAKLLNELGLQNDKALADLLEKADVKAILRVVINSGQAP